MIFTDEGKTKLLEYAAKNGVDADNLRDEIIEAVDTWFASRCRNDYDDMGVEIVPCGTTWTVAVIPVNCEAIRAQREFYPGYATNNAKTTFYLEDDFLSLSDEYDANEAATN